MKNSEEYVNQEEDMEWVYAKDDEDEDDDWMREAVGATHEAGHGIMAVLLRIPIKLLHIQSYESVDGVSIGGECELMITELKDHLWKSHFHKKALMTIASRVACTMQFSGLDECELEETYKYDEQGLNLYSILLDIHLQGLSQEEWRAKLLEEATQIMNKSYIKEAIQLVAQELMEKKKISGRMVRKIVRQCKKRMKMQR